MNKIFAFALKNELKKNVSIFIIVLVLLCIILPGSFMMQIGNIEETYISQSSNALNNQNDIFNTDKLYVTISELNKLKENIVIDTFGVKQMSAYIIGIGAFLAIFFFSYLHHKKQVDFYHSLALNRKKIYFYKYITGLLCFLIPYILTTIFSIMCIKIKGIYFSDIYTYIFFAFLINTLYFVLSYSLFIFIVLITGKFFVASLGIAATLVAFPLLSYGLELYHNAFFKTYYMYNDTFLPLFKKLQFLSPLVSLQRIGKEYNAQISNEWVGLDVILSKINMTLIIVAFLIIIIIFLSIKIYKIRPLERSESVFAFDILKPITRIPIVLLSGILGISLYAITPKLEFGIIGVVGFCIISHVVLEIIYNNDFKKAFNNKISLTCCIAFSLLVLAMFKTDFFKYDEFLPQNKELKNASIVIYDEILDYSSFQKNIKGHYEYVDPNEKLMSEMKLQNEDSKASILNIAKGAIEELKQGKDKLNESTVNILYEFNNGKKEARTYKIDLRTYLNSYNKIFNDKNYKEKIYPLININNEDISELVLKDINGKTTFDEKEKIENIVKAYKLDLLNQKLEDKIDTYPIAIISFKIKDKDINQVADLRYENYMSSRAVIREIQMDYPIYENFDNVKEALKQTDYEFFDIKNYDYKLPFIIYNNGSKYSEVQVTDIDDKKCILNNFVYYDFYYHNQKLGKKTIENFHISLRQYEMSDGLVFENEDTLKLAEKYAN
ncbi:MAG: DUF6449 domain-containing protein [Eubacteriales bacterium]|nr:DUF6449 domain-containing protein [Eubacteriales bacterium]